MVGLAIPYLPLPSQPGFEDGLKLPGASIDAGSPTLADLNADGKKEVVVGGRDGRIYAIESTGHLLWQFDGAAALNAIVPNPGVTAVSSAPAVADLNRDGRPEVVVALGKAVDVGNNGGIVVLNNQGGLMPGWPRLSLDHIDQAGLHGDGYADGFWSSPAVGDIDGDGDLEIVAGGWDMRLYAWHHDGKHVEGWPRFLHNTTWSSPVLADLDKDGRLEIITGADDDSGGRLLVFKSDGSSMPGFPRSIDQTIFSSPAVADLDGDGWLDIVVGTGNFYAGRGYAVHAWSHTGTYLPGWPVATGGFVLSSPAVGDIDGDGAPEVVVGCNDGKLYAWNGDGSRVSGWPVVVVDNFGNGSPLNFASPILANFDADPYPEVFINMQCDIMVLDGNGAYLTHVGNSGSSGLPNINMTSAKFCPLNTPAAGDIDGDGRLEIARGNGTAPDGQAQLWVWESSRTPATAPWAMFRGDAAHQARYQPTLGEDALIVTHTLPEIMRPGESRTVEITVRNTGSRTWQASDQYRLAAQPGDMLAPGASIYLQTGESVAPNQTKQFKATIQAPSAPGYYLASWRMQNGQGAWFGRSAFRYVKVGNEPAFHVLTRNQVPAKDALSPEGTTTGIMAGGLAMPLPPPAGFWNWSAAKDVGFVPSLRGYYLLDTEGAIWPGGTADAIGGHGFVEGAQEILVRSDGTSYYILDRFGRLVASYGAWAISPMPNVGNGTAQSAALTPDELGVYVLDAYGNVHRGGSAQPLVPATPVFADPLAKKIQLTADGKGYYVLDSYGRVWNGGTAASIAANYAFHVGEDWARDLELTDDGQGYYLVDKEGGIWTGGTAVAPSVNPTQVWPGQDVALSLIVGDSRVLEGLVTVPESLGCMTTPKQACSWTVQVGTSGTDSQQWTATSQESWISLSPTSGSTPGKLNVTVSAGSLPKGTHEGQVVVKNDISTLTLRVLVQVADRIFQSHLPFVAR